MQALPKKLTWTVTTSIAISKTCPQSRWATTTLPMLLKWAPQVMYSAVYPWGQ